MIRYTDTLAQNTSPPQFFRPPVDVLAGVMQRLQGEYDALRDLEFDVPDHLPQDRDEVMKFKAELDSRREAIIEESRSNFGAAKRKTRDLVRDYTRETQPGGRHHAFEARKAEYGAIAERIRKQYDNPEIQDYYVSNITVDDFDGTASGVNAPALVNHQSTKDLMSYYDKILDNISSNRAVWKSNTPEKIRNLGFKYALASGNREYINFDTVAQVLVANTTPDIVRSVEEFGKITTKKEGHGNYFGVDNKNNIVFNEDSYLGNMLKGMALGKSYYKDSEKRQLVTDSLGLESYKIEQERIKDRTIFQLPSGNIEFPKVTIEDLKKTIALNSGLSNSAIETIRHIMIQEEISEADRIKLDEAILTKNNALYAMELAQSFLKKANSLGSEQGLEEFRKINKFDKGPTAKLKDLLGEKAYEARDYFMLTEDLEKQAGQPIDSIVNDALQANISPNKFEKFIKSKYDIKLTNLSPFRVVYKEVYNTKKEYAEALDKDVVPRQQFHIIRGTNNTLLEKFNDIVAESLELHNIALIDEAGNSIDSNTFGKQMSGGKLAIAPIAEPYNGRPAFLITRRNEEGGIYKKNGELDKTSKIVTFSGGNMENIFTDIYKDMLTSGNPNDVEAGEFGIGYYLPSGENFSLPVGQQIEGLRTESWSNGESTEDYTGPNGHIKTPYFNIKITKYLDNKLKVQLFDKQGNKFNPEDYGMNTSLNGGVFNSPAKLIQEIGRFTYNLEN